MTSGFPRLNCIVEGCKRGTTRFPALEDGGVAEFICGDHWRRVPSSWRRRLSLFKRRAREATRRGGEPGTLERFHRAEGRLWERCKRIFDEPALSDELPVALELHLRDLGL